MRFDPQANFVEEDTTFRNVAAPPPVAVDHFPPGVGVRSPLKTALIILTLGFAAGGGYWIWNEGIPGAHPKTPSSSLAIPEAQITGGAAGNALKSGAGSGRMTAGKRRTRVREEYDAGRKLMAMGQHDEAVPHFAEAVRLDPTYAEALYRLGLAHVQAGDYKEAKRTRAKLAKLDSDLANLLAHLIEK